MTKTQETMPLRTSADRVGHGLFILEDFGHGSYHLRITPEGMGLLADYGEYMSPLNPVHEREFIGLCELLDYAIVMAIDMTEPAHRDEDRIAAQFDLDDEIPF